MSSSSASGPTPNWRRGFRACLKIEKMPDFWSQGGAFCVKNPRKAASLSCGFFLESPRFGTKIRHFSGFITDSRLSPCSAEPCKVKRPGQPIGKPGFSSVCPDRMSAAPSQTLTSARPVECRDSGRDGRTRGPPLQGPEHNKCAAGHSPTERRP